MSVNNWYVISGAPSSGKTTIINALQERGFSTVPEVATAVIEREMKKGRTLEDIRLSDKAWLQKQIIDLQLDLQKDLNPQETLFLDRGIPDIFAFYAFYQLPINDYLTNAYRSAEYKKVFLFDRLPLEKNHVRIENEDDLRKLDRLHEEAYKKLKLPYLRVPTLPINERVDFILENL